MDQLQQAPVKKCALCSHQFLHLEKDYFMKIGQGGMFGQSKQGIICFRCYQEIDGCMQKIKARKK